MSQLQEYSESVDGNGANAVVAPRRAPETAPAIRGPLAPGHRALVPPGDGSQPPPFEPPPRERMLPVWASRVRGHLLPTWFLVAAHGGAGATTIERYSQESWPLFAVDAGCRWPNPALEPTGATVVVARTHMAGLARARDAALQLRSGAAPNRLNLLGLLLVPDAPGRLPRPLGSARRLLTGAYPRIWTVPYIRELRLVSGLDPREWPAAHPVLVDVLDEITSLAISKGSGQ